MRAWIQLALGTWVALSPWTLGASDNVFVVWSGLAAGLAIVILNLWTIFGEEEAPDATPESEAKLETKKGNGKTALGSSNTKAQSSNS